MYPGQNNHYYLAAGSLVQWALSQQWVATGDLMLGKTLSPTIDDSPDGLNHAALGSAPLIRLGLEADYRLGPRLHFFTGFDYSYFSYGQSDVFPSGPSNGVLEPLSQTQAYNLNIGLRLSY